MRLVHLRGMKNLKRLDLSVLPFSKSKLTDKAVAYLKDLKSLEELNLSHSAVTEKGIKEIQAAAPCRRQRSSIRFPVSSDSAEKKPRGIVGVLLPHHRHIRQRNGRDGNLVAVHA